MRSEGSIPAAVTGHSIGTSRQGNDTVVLCKGRHGSHGGQGRKDRTKTVGQDTSLDTGIENLALDFESRDIAGGGDIADGFTGTNHEDGY